MNGKKISKFIKHALIGMILGDTHLETFNQGETYRVVVKHSPKQIEYLEHKYRMLEHFIRSGIKNCVERRSDNTKVEKKYFHTFSSSSFKFYANMFKIDSEGNKKLPMLIHRYLDPVCLAYWYMDDGSLKSAKTKALKICISQFKPKEIQILVDCLNKKHNLNCKMYKWRSSFRIYIPNDNNNFSNLIRKYVVPSMEYKLP